MSVNPEQHLIKDIDQGLVDRWTQYSTALNEGSERGEAQSFILRCVEALHRERQVSCHCADRHAVPIHTLNMIRFAPFTPHCSMHDLTTALDLSVNINIMIFGQSLEGTVRRGAGVLCHVISTDLKHLPYALRYKTRVW